MAAVAALDEMAGAVSAVAEGVGPSVAAVGRRGSGVVMGEDLVATNAHNVQGPDVEVVFADGRVAMGQVAATDPDGDLAVLRVATSGAPTAKWGDGHLTLGTPVLAVANPGGRGLRVTLGLVSSVQRSFRGPRGRRIAGGFEHTAPLARGSSGGPVTDREGRVVGLNTHRLEHGLYLAVPVDASLRQRLDALARGDVPTRARLGVAVVPPHAARRLRSAVGLPERDGLLVRAVEQDGPAAAAGIRRGDLLVSAGDQRLDSLDAFYAVLDTVEAGTPLAIGVVRGSEELSVEVLPVGRDAGPRSG